MKTIYLNIEDDLPKITAKLKRELAVEIVLVFPRQSFLFSDQINLMLLKKQVDLLAKRVAILTMDEQGQNYARQAGFELKSMPSGRRLSRSVDINPGHSKSGERLVVRQVQPLIKRKKIVKSVLVDKKVLAKTDSKKTVFTNTVVEVGAVNPLSVTRNNDNVFEQLNIDQDFEKTSFFTGRRRFWIISTAAVVIAVFMFTALVILPRADVVIYAKPRPITRELDINIDTKLEKADPSQLVLPAVALEDSLQVDKSFQTVGKREVGSKAQGRVAIYNLTGKPLSLKSTTTTLSSEGKIYLFLDDQEDIRSTLNPNDESEVTIADVVAKDGGEGFNLASGTRLEISNQVFGSQPQRLYAKSVTAVSGGSSRFISVMSEEDNKQARKELDDMLVGQLSQKLGDKGVVVEEGYSIANPVFNTDKPVGSESPSFQASLKADVTALAYDPSAMKELVRSRLSATLPPDSILQSADKDSISIKVRSYDFKAGTMAVTVNYESQIVTTVDPQSLRKQISGKSKQETSELLLSRENVDRVDVTLYPSWQRSLPWWKKKINIQIRQ